MKIKSNVVIITIAVIVGIIGIVLSFVFDLYGYIGVVGGAILNICVFFGVFGALEIDDWTIWYKRWVIKKFYNSTGSLCFKVYDENLKKHYVKVDAKVVNYEITDNQDIIFLVRVNIKTPVDNSRIYNGISCMINPITNGVTILDGYGNTYNCKKLQYSFGDAYTNFNKDMIIFKDYLKDRFNENAKYNNLYPKCEKLTINPDSFTYKVK